MAERGCKVVGVDSSPIIVATARSLGVSAFLIDGHMLPFTGEFDVVFSNATLHPVKRRNEVMVEVWRTLMPGSRFVGEFGGFGNVSVILNAIQSFLSSRGIALPCPWFFPKLEEYRSLLEAGGFEVKSAALIPGPTPLSGDISNWLETTAKPYLSALSVDGKQACIGEVVTKLRSVLYEAQGHSHADYVRLRCTATKAGGAVRYRGEWSPTRTLFGLGSPAPWPARVSRLAFERLRVIGYKETQDNHDGRRIR